eukprot:1091703-Amphidinium_carterae.1
MAGCEFKCGSAEVPLLTCWEPAMLQGPVLFLPSAASAVCQSKDPQCKIRKFRMPINDLVLFNDSLMFCAWAIGRMEIAVLQHFWAAFCMRVPGYFGGRESGSKCTRRGKQKTIESV